MEFTLWSKQGLEPRLYLTPNTPGGAYLYLLKSGQPRVKSKFSDESSSIFSSLSKNGLMNAAYLSFSVFEEALIRHGHVVNKPGAKNPKQPMAGTSPQKSDYANMTTPAQLYNEALALDPGSVKFLRGISPYTITVDTREPDTLFPLIQSSGLKTMVETLQLGDIRVTHRDTQDELIFERKTVSDLYSSIISNHAHRQAEMLFEYQAERAAAGHRVQIFWLVEGEGQRSLYNAFPKMVQTDGVINYFSAILGQGVLQTFNMQHTAYLAVKLAQGYFEQELPYKVNEKARKSRTAQGYRDALNVLPKEQGAYHGVRGDKNPLMQMLMAIPSLREPAVKQIIEKGHKLSDVLRYSQSDWLALEGVGKVLSERLVKEIQAIL